MKIDRIEVANVLGLCRADIDIPGGILLVAGPNMSGKSSLRDAISMALTGTPARVSKKKDLDQALHDGAKKGRATVFSGGEVIGEFKLPKGEFAALPSDERRSLLFKVTGCGASMKVITPMLEKLGVDMELFGEVSSMLRSGFPAAEKYAADKAREAKGAWRVTTGEVWGSEKADGWEVELQGECPSVEETDKVAALVLSHQERIEAGVQFHGGLIQQQKQAEGRAGQIAELQEKADSLKRVNIKLKTTRTDLADWETKVTDLTEALATARAAAELCECPSCGTSLRMEAGKLVEASAASSGASAADLQTQLNEAKTARDLLRRTETNDVALVAAANAAGDQLKQAQEEAPAFDEALMAKTVAGIDQMRTLLQQDKAKLDALLDKREEFNTAKDTTDKAAAFNTEISKWLAIADAMAPDGIPGELLGLALAPINQSLEVLAGMAGWPIVRITRDIDILSNERTYGLCSESEKWRADTLIALAIAQLTGLKLVVLDRFDVLQPNARGRLMGMLVQLVELGSIDTAVVLGTLKEAPAGQQGITGVWVNGGIAEAVGNA